MSRLPALFFAVVCPSALLACSDDAAESKAHKRADAAAAMQASAEDAGPAVDATSASKEAGVGDGEEAFVPPSNSSFDSARAVASGEVTMQRVLHQGQVDYYSFEAKAGSFYVVSTNLSGFAPNNVISVFDTEHTKIAENNDGSLYPGDQIDARLVVRPEHSGTYFVTATDPTAQSAQSDGRFIPPAFYALTLREINADTAGFVLEKDGQSQALTLVEDMAAHARYVTLLGVLSDDDKSDTYELHGMPDSALIGRLLAAGDSGDGSSAGAVSVRVTADSDGHLLGRCSLASGQSNIHPPVDDASYRIEVSAGDAAGANGFYAIDLVLLADNPHEHTEPDNNNIGSAEPITMMGMSSRRGLLLSRLPAEDVDYYRFEAQADERVKVQCEGESGGSGVRGLQAEVLAPSKQSLMSGRETSTKALLIDPFKLETTGTHYLKLTSATPASTSDAVEPWVRCAVAIGQ